LKISQNDERNASQPASSIAVTFEIHSGDENSKTNQIGMEISIFNVIL